MDCARDGLAKLRNEEPRRPSVKRSARMLTCQRSMVEVTRVLHAYPAFVRQARHRWQLGRDGMDFGGLTSREQPGPYLLSKCHLSRDTVRAANWSQPVLEKVSSEVVGETGDASRGRMVGRAHDCNFLQSDDQLAHYTSPWSALELTPVPYR
jgi:hypothetical protein